MTPLLPIRKSRLPCNGHSGQHDTTFTNQEGAPTPTLSPLHRPTSDCRSQYTRSCPRSILTAAFSLRHQKYVSSYNISSLLSPRSAFLPPRPQCVILTTSTLNCPTSWSPRKYFPAPHLQWLSWTTSILLPPPPQQIRSAQYGVHTHAHAPALLEATQ